MALRNPLLDGPAGRSWGIPAGSSWTTSALETALRSRELYHAASRPLSSDAWIQDGYQRRLMDLGHMRDWESRMYHLQSPRLFGAYGEYHRYQPGDYYRGFSPVSSLPGDYFYDRPYMTSANPYGPYIGSPYISPAVSPYMSPQVSPYHSPYASPHITPVGSPMASYVPPVQMSGLGAGMLGMPVDHYGPPMGSYPASLPMQDPLLSMNHLPGGCFHPMGSLHGSLNVPPGGGLHHPMVGPMGSMSLPPGGYPHYNAVNPASSLHNSTRCQPKVRRRSSSSGPS